MKRIMPLTALYQKLLNLSRYLEGLAPLALRIYLAPVLLQAGYNKLSHFEDTVAWFANPDWGLGLPMPALMATLAAGTEFFWGHLITAWAGD
ncbi:hypothetical protein SOHN41_02400 [Shewanella sp. HN-41]|nr:hypothetical protein SOHN41_02400 [Shewanella sp. HN-41]